MRLKTIVRVIVTFVLATAMTWFILFGLTVAAFLISSSLECSYSAAFLGLGADPSMLMPESNTVCKAVSYIPNLLIVVGISLWIISFRMLNKKDFLF